MSLKPMMLPVTRFPALDASIKRSELSRETISGTRLTRNTSSSGQRRVVPPEDRLDQHVLHAFASFVLSLTGDDEASFSFESRESDLRKDHVSVCSSEHCYGVVHATATDTLRQSDKDARHLSCTITVQYGSTCETDFSVVIFPRVPNEFDPESSISKPFVAIVDDSSVAISVGTNLVPDALLDSVFFSLAAILGFTQARDANDNADLSSILNHPAKMDPPYWEGHCRTSPRLPLSASSVLHLAFSKRAQEHPDKPAVDFLQCLPSTHDVYSYADVDRISSELAQYILSILEPVYKGTLWVVPMFLPTSPELYISWLAILKAGCAVCPLPVEAPAELLSGILDDVTAPLILSRGPAPDHLPFGPASGRKWVDVQEFVDYSRKTAKTAFIDLPSLQGDDVAYIMYTSGSTGRPKGVPICHASASCSISSHILFVPQAENGQDNPRWFQFAAPTFDPSVMEIFVTLSTGGTICACERTVALTDPEAAITELRADIMMATPSMAALLRPEKVPTLRNLWTMGELLGRSVIENFAYDSTTRPAGDKRTLLNAYGPTEASINCTLNASVSRKQRGAIIGYPLPTCSILILDPLSRDPVPVPLGFSGELAIGGPQVSKGYLNRPDQTAAAFVESPIYGQLYRTGDRARVVGDLGGNLVVEFLGRISSGQVKLSGRRVELGEIEAIIDNSLVAEVAAIAAPSDPTSGESGSEQVVVFLVPWEPCDEKALYGRCVMDAARLLQPHMQPSKYYLVGSLPKSVSGKLDRKALERMYSSSQSAEAQTMRLMDFGDKSGEDALKTTDDGPIFEQIRQAIAQVTRESPDNITASTRLASLGFDSLRSVRFLQHARDRELPDLSITDILPCCTVRDLARRYLSPKSSSGPAIGNNEARQLLTSFGGKHLVRCANMLSVDASSIETILPTTATQAGMLASFLRSLTNISANISRQSSRKTYINHSIYTIAPEHETSRVQEAWSTVLSHHDMSRTVFVQIDDDLTPFAQCIFSDRCPASSLRWGRYTCDQDTDFDGVTAKAVHDAEDSISLDRPPIRVSLVQSNHRSAIVLSIMHAVFDAGSLRLFLQDVEREYRQLGRIERNGVDTAVLRHFGSDRQGAADHWRETMKDNSSTSLQALNPMLSKRGSIECETTSLNSDLTLEYLQSKAARMNCSPLSVLQTAWTLVLSAYTGNTADVTFGSVISDRFSTELINCSGPTFTTIPIRVSLSNKKSRTIRDVAKTLTRLNNSALHNLHTPLSALTGEDGRLPYDTLFAFQDFLQGTGGDNLLYSDVKFSVMLNDFAAMTEVWPTTSGKLQFKITFNCKLLDNAAADSILQKIIVATQNILEAPQRLFSDSQTDFPQHLLSYGGVSNRETTNPTKLLHHQFEHHAKYHPDDLALVFRSELSPSAEEFRMTYKQLDEKAERIASYLRQYMLESKRGPIIPICMEKCPEVYITILGILKAGAAWCPIDASFPAARQQQLVERTGASLLLTAHSVITTDGGAVPPSVRLLEVTNILAAKTDAPHSPPEKQTSTTDLAYLIFTSGTTGLPKGVPITHLAASSAMDSLAELIPGNPNGTPIRCLQFAQYTFDVFVQDLFYTWHVGGAVISSPRQLTIGAFSTLSNVTEATHAHLTPAFAASVRRAECHTLNVVTFIGEKLSQAVADEWGEDMLAFNTYGPAEAAVVATVRQFGFGRVAQNDTCRVRSSNVGWPLPTVQAYVMQNDKPVMKGSPGELVLVGGQLAQGYWKDEKNTKAKFVFDETLGKLLYHTGDVVRQLEDGSFDFLGRNDDLIKIAGMRIELSEIAYICRDGHNQVDVAEVMYTALPGSTEKALVCFLACGALSHTSDEHASVLDSDEAAEVALTVSRWSASQLPNYMVPDVFLVINAIPRTPSAKVDRKGLLGLLEASNGPSKKLKQFAQGVDASDDSKWKVHHAGLLQTLRSITKFPNSRIDPTTTLSELGIDSIRAITLGARLKGQGYPVSVLDVLGCRCVHDIVSLVFEPEPAEQGNWKDDLEQFNKYWMPLAVDALNESSFYIAPTTIMQEGMLTETMRRPTSYWGNYFFSLAEFVDLSRLQEAWTRVASSTEALRVGFIPAARIADSDSSGGDKTLPFAFLQVVHDSVIVPWYEEDYDNGHWDIIEVAQAAGERIATHHQAQGFPSPPWRVTILNLVGARTMMLTLHHAIYDATSIQHLEQDLAAAYYKRQPTIIRCQLGEAMGRVAFAQDQDSSTKFWENQLTDFGSEDNPVSMLGATSSSNNAAVVHRTEEMLLSLRLPEMKKAASSLGASSVSPIFHVAWGTILSELMESTRVLFAEIRSDRVLDARLADAIAPLLSTVPVPFSLAGSPRQMISKHSLLSSESLKHRFIRPATLRTLLQKPASEILYPAILVFHPKIDDTRGLDTKLWKRLDELLDISVEHTFALNIFETIDDGVRLSLSVDSTIMDSKMQRMFLQEIDALIQAMVRHPDAPSMAHLTNYFPEALRSVNPGKPLGDYPVHRTPAYWVEHWAQSHPDWNAVEVAQESGVEQLKTISWTYDKLNATANRVAALIRNRGGCSGMIGVCLDRTLLSVAIILGIMKSGNAYVPIEKSLPLERKVFLLNDSAATLFFTSASLFDISSVPNNTQLVDVTKLDFSERLGQMDSTNPQNQSNPDKQAYLLYTSGSTGKPKGVLVSGTNLSSFTEAQSTLICSEAPATRRLGGTGKYLCLASSAFDVHIAELFLAWRHGMCATTGSRMLLLDNLALSLSQLHITHASFVPSLLDQTGLTPADAPDLVYLGVGGEKMTPTTQSIWASSDSVALVNAYGPTECTIGCCSGRLYPDSDTRNIGSPLGDSIAYVFVPGTDIPVKRGMPGELAFSGSLVATGYHNRPGARGFVDCADGTRLYHTGDIVCMAPNGSIIFLGRKDDQVKVRGQRLELGEISEAVRKVSEEPIDVITLLLQHPRLPRLQLVAFTAVAGAKKERNPIFLSRQYAATNKKLRARCEQVLPAYMVPDMLLPVSCLPLTETSAKADVKLLKALFQSITVSQILDDRNKSKTEPCRTLTPTESQVLKTIQSVAPRHSTADVRPESSIFELGIDSLGAIAISFKLQKAGYECSAASVLQNPTIEELAVLPKKGGRTTSGPDLAVLQHEMMVLADSVKQELLNVQSSIRNDGIKDIWPCFPLQEALVAHTIAHADQGRDADYVNHMIFELPEHIDLPLLRNAWQRVVEANDILRTSFYCTAACVAQIVLRSDYATTKWNELTFNDAQALPDVLKAVKGHISKDITNSIEERPPFRLTLASSTGDSSHRQTRLLMLSIHHGLYDMESLEMVLKDVELFYGQKAVLPRPPIKPLVDYMALQKAKSAEAQSYWTALFKGWSSAPFHDIPEAPPATAEIVFKADLKALEGQCSKAGFTLPGLMQGLFAYAMAQTQKQDDAVFGVVLSGRSIGVDNVENMMVPCITTLPQRINLNTDGNTVLELVTELQRRSFAALQYQHTSLRDIQAWIGATGPLFQSIFSFIRGDSADATSSDTPESVLRLLDGQMSLEHALAVECEANVRENKLVLRTSFNPTCEPFKQAGLMLEKMEVLAGAILRGDKVPVTPAGKSAVATYAAAERLFEPQEHQRGWNGLEKKIRDAIVTFSRVNATEIDEIMPFIRFGIDSISSIRFARQLRDTGVQVSSADVVRNPTVVALANHIRKSLPQARDGKSNGIQHKEESSLYTKLPSEAGPWSSGDRISAVYQLTPLQSGMISSTLAIDSQLYSHHHAFLLSQHIDLDRIERAWQALLGRQDILRTSFHQSATKQGLWLGAVHAEPMVKWEVVSVHDANDGLRKVAQETRYHDSTSFTQPPVKATVIKDGPTAVLVVSLHHVVYDGMSIRMIFEDLGRLYGNQECCGRPPFSLAASNIMKSLEASTDFWSRRVKDYRSFRLPTRYISQCKGGLTSATVQMTDDVSKLTEQCLGLNTNVSDAAAFAFGKALCCLRGARDVVFGQVVAGRNIAVDRADLISGPLFNTVPCRLRLSSTTATNRESLRQWQEFVNESLDHQHGSLMDIQRRWRKETKTDDPLLDSLFVFQKDVKQANPVQDDEALWTPYEPVTDTDPLAPPEYALNFELHQAGDSLFVKACSKMEQVRLGQFIDMFRRALTSIFENTDELTLAVPGDLASLPLEPVQSNQQTKPADAGEFDEGAIARYFEPLCRILSEVVADAPRNGIRPHISVFSIGLDSILAIRVATACRKEGIPLGTADIIQGITPGRMCELALAKAQKTTESKPDKSRRLVGADSERLALSKMGLSGEQVDVVLPALPGQAYHLKCWLKSGRTLFEPTWAFRTRKPLDENRLRLAWKTLRHTHSNLRTTFVAPSPEQALQVVLSESAAPEQDSTFTVHEVEKGTGEDLADALIRKTKAVICRIAQSPSDLFSTPVRFTVVRGGEAGDAVLITLHHGVYDAWAMGLLMGEFSSLYQGLPIDPPPSFTQFVRETLSNQQPAKAESFWREAIGRAEETIVQASTRTVRVNERTDSLKQTSIMYRASTVDLGLLEKTVQSLGVTPHAILHLAFARLLRSATGSAHPIFGYFQAGRSAGFDGIEALAGPCVNMLPASVPGEVAAATTASGTDRAALTDLLRAIQQGLGARMPFEQSYLGDVLRWGGIGGDGVAPFNTYLNILWGEEMLVSNRIRIGGQEAPFEMMDLGVPTDYSATEPMAGATAVDGLETGMLRDRNVFVDVGPNREANRLEFGARSDAVLLDEEGLTGFVAGFDGEVLGLCDCLREG